VQRLLHRSGLPRRRDRLGLLEHHSAGTCGLLTKRTRRQLARARGVRSRHVHATQPGELVCLDTFYIGKLKGVGKVRQVTACDAACSYGGAWVLPELSAEATASFLRQILVPRYRHAGWPLQRILADGGSEFKAAFAAACQALGIRHTRTLPRHAWDQRLRRAAAGDDPPRALAYRVSAPVLYTPPRDAAQPRRVHDLLQRAATAPGLSPARSDAGRAVHGRGRPSELTS
jgi:hypothetical protein